MSRRSVLRTAVAGAPVLGFDPVGRGWLARPAPRCRRRVAVFRGSTVRSVSIRRRSQLRPTTSRHIVHRTPMAVLEPGSVKTSHGWSASHDSIGSRSRCVGRGHTTYGRAQVEGIVVDSTKLTGIQFNSGGRVVVGAGVLWADVVREAFTRGLTPPILTDYLGLSVGGTLALGGIGGQVSKVGAQVDNVLEARRRHR